MFYIHIGKEQLFTIKFDATYLNIVSKLNLDYLWVLCVGLQPPSPRQVRGLQVRSQVDQGFLAQLQLHILKICFFCREDGDIGL